MNPFAEKYKTLTTAQLLAVIDTPENYQRIAVNAAEDELLARNTSIAEMTEARATNEAAANELAAKTDRKKTVEDEFVNAAGAVIDTISPVQKTPASMNRVILLISIVFGFFGLVALYHFADFMISMWRMHFPVSIMKRYLFEGFFLMGTAYLFWKRKKWGWVFLVVFVTNSIVGAVANMVTEMWRAFFLPKSYFEIFYTPSLTSILFGVLFYVCCIWYLYKSGTRSLYQVDKHLSILSAAAGVLLALLTFALIAA